MVRAGLFGLLLVVGTAHAQPAPDPFGSPRGKVPVRAPGDPFEAPRPMVAQAPQLDTGARPADPYAATAVPRVAITDVPAVQGLLAVQRLGGWLLTGREGSNPIARALVAPTGAPTHAWFYWIPTRGEPTRLVHAAETASFAHLAGKVMTYGGYKELEKQLKVLLKGARTIALEYSPKAAVPALSRVDAGTLELVRAAGVKVRPSDTLVQYTKAIWGDAGRTAHFVAAHHLVELRREALQFAAAQLAAGRAVSEYDVQQRIARGMTTRGLVGPAPRVATGVNTADPNYVATAAKTAAITRGDVIVVGVAGKLAKPAGIFAAHTWVAVAEAAPSAEVAAVFEAVKTARTAALALIQKRAAAGRALTGAEVDRTARASFTKAKLGDRVLHRTGHSLDDELQGAGADLDDVDVKDTRILTAGTGFTVGPGLYTAGRFGIRSEVSAYLGPAGLEVTTAVQDAIEPLFVTR